LEIPRLCHIDIRQSMLANMFEAIVPHYVTFRTATTSDEIRIAYVELLCCSKKERALYSCI